MKKWFNFQLSNPFIYLFIINIIFLGLVIYLKDTFYTEFGFYISLSIPIIVLIMISYGAFYKFWNEQKDNYN